MTQDDATSHKETEWWVYVLESEQPRFSKRGLKLHGVFYVGSSVNPLRRLKQHNGLVKGGGRYTSRHRPWQLKAVYGPYRGRSEAFKAEMALKHGKRGVERTRWSPNDSIWCRGEGVLHPWCSRRLSPTTEQDP